MCKKYILLAGILCFSLFYSFGNAVNEPDNKVFTDDSGRTVFSFARKTNDVAEKKPVDYAKIDTVLKYAHASAAGITYAGF